MFFSSSSRTLMKPPIEPVLAYPDRLPDSAEPLSLIVGTTFFAANRQGDLMPPGAPHVGLFHSDTRFLSQYELRFNAQEPLVLSCTTTGADTSRVELTVRGGVADGDNLEFPVNTVYVHREQVLDRDHLFDVLEIESFHDAEVRLTVELRFAADFMDIFQVRGLLRGKSGRYFEPEINQSAVSFCYEGLDRCTRMTELCFDPLPQTLEPNRALWRCRLAPHGTIRLAITTTMAGEESTAARPHIPEFDQVRAASVDRHAEWQQVCTRFRSDNDIFDTLLQNAIEDFYALRMPEPAGTAVAAGVPWFAALFGRDALLSSYETLVLDPDIARGTLRVLAAYQGQEANDEHDEDPGKILHERRYGEMTNTGEVAFGRCYGSVDSTPLFLSLVHECYTWTADEQFLRDIAPHLKAATNWILECGDLDGDGLIEYCRRNPKGLFNQGWKDSGDAIRHSDGRIAEPPIALVEVQGYAVRALASAARLLKFLGETELAARAADRSAQLRTLIRDRFWMKDRGYYAMALDRDKVPVAVESSNPGHLLFSQAISAERAQKAVDRLLDGGLFSGWGIRTLSSAESYFNPMSYHCGSVWPHDNALIGCGMARYGFHGQAGKVFQALYDAALRFRDYRLPELFCGVQRQPRSEPVHYPVSCSPQAWASGAPFLLLTGMLGLRPSADRGELAIIDPSLPPFLNRIRIDNLRVGSSRVALEFEREDQRTYCNVAAIHGDPLKVSIVFGTQPR